jgi:hypothetical protein
MYSQTVCKKYVESCAGVYFFMYSVPEVIASYIRLVSDLGPGANIYHQSVVHSDGNGKVETITAGPANGSAWYKQAGLAPLKAQIAFLAHPESSQIKNNFDSIPWSHPGIKKIFVRTNWSTIDFKHAKSYIISSTDRISSVSYNLGGHNSNSFITLIWKQAFLHAAESGRSSPDNPNYLLTEYFRPGSNFSLFDNNCGYYIDLISNWLYIAKNVGLIIFYLSASRARQLLAARRGVSHLSATQWYRKWRNRA